MSPKAHACSLIGLVGAWVVLTTVAHWMGDHGIAALASLVIVVSLCLFRWCVDHPLETTVDRGKWQPIATAPRDGRMVMLWWRDERGDAWWATARWERFSDSSEAWIGRTFHCDVEHSWTCHIGVKPTHWCLLDAADAPEVCHV